MPSLQAPGTAALRADVWHTANPYCRARFHLLGEAEADLPCRVLNLFALQGLVLETARIERLDELLSMECLLTGLSWHRAQVIAEKLRNLISVCSVDLQDADIARAEPMLAAG
ncbi:hypothetical protein J3P80_23990 [Pseudomonas sp. D2-30]|uniref:hypothetical protein n=1 Tax=unclassified Pseudomonas TaxID=196821 RepID=UPI003DA9A7AA